MRGLNSIKAMAIVGVGMGTDSDFETETRKKAQNSNPSHSLRFDFCPFWNLKYSKEPKES